MKFKKYRHSQHKKKEQDDLIIDRPEALSPVRRRVELSLTAIGWAIWFFLCRPLMIAFLWFLGFQLFYEHMVRLGGLSGLVDFVFVYLAVIFALYLLIRGWNFYNAKKFKGRDRRKMDKAVTAHDLESYFRLVPQTAEKAREWKDVTVDFADKHQIFLKETADPNVRARYKGHFKPT